MSSQHNDELRIAERAAEWHGRLNHATPEECSEFMAWLEESPRHVREFLLMQAWDVEAAGIDPDKQIDVQALLGRNDLNVVPLQSQPRIRQKPLGVSSKEPSKHPATAARFGKTRRWVWAGLAAAAVAAIAWFAPGGFIGTHHYATAVGEQRAIELEDGSLVQLNTQSRIEIRMTAQRREIRLLEGEALFKVAHDAQRPFRVDAGGTAIRVLGTQFNVDRRRDSVKVSVVEGRVQVAQDILRPGEEVRVANSGAVSRNAVDVSTVAVWRQRRLIFKDDTLGDIATEFNRYNRTPQIVIEGDYARNKRYGGIFDADDPESLAQFVSKDGDVPIRRENERIVIGKATQ